ncbi:MAG: hypothetical protein ACQEUZ_01855 [Pseudomonadota bacterium]
MTIHDPLLSGFFSIADAAHLLNTPQQRLRGWLNGYARSVAGPVIERDFVGSRAVSFLDLMELRFIAFFRPHVSMQTIRRAAETARKEWAVQHPLALSSEHYVTDRKRIFAKSAEASGDESAWDMATGQHEMWATIEQTIEKGVVFDPDSHLARAWSPRPGEFPKVIINPRIAFGKPVVAGSAVPTKVLYAQWKSEGHKSRVAKWFEVPESVVDIAVAYELSAA